MSANRKSKLQLLAEIEHAKGGVSAHVIDLDKESAEWALRTSDGNRDENESDIVAQAGAMDRDEYIFDGNTLSFERGLTEQRLFDGHHRCKARLLAKTAKPVMVAVTFNSPPGSQRIRVSGRRWSPKDWSVRLGLTPSHAPIITAIRRAVDGSTGGQTRDEEILAAMAVGADGINVVVERTKKHNKLSISPITAGIAMAWKVYPASALSFLHSYLEGGRPIGCPSNALRDHILVRGRIATLQWDERVKLTWSTISAVAAMNAGREMRVVRPSASVVEPVLDCWSAVRGGRRADVAEWMKSHQKNRHDAK